MSIFSGLSPQNLRIAAQAAKESPQALAAVAIVAVVAVLMIGVAVSLTAHHVGAFASRVQEEDERDAQEERALEGGDSEKREREE